MVDVRDSEIYVVVGWGTSQTPAVREAPSQVWNWAIAQLLCGLSSAITGLLSEPDRWCKIVHTSWAELDADSSVVAFHPLPIPPLALAAWDVEVQRAAQQGLKFGKGDGASDT